MNSETIVSDSDAFEASFRNWFWSDDKKDPDAADVIEDALAKDLDADEKVGDEAPTVDVALPNDVGAYDEQIPNDVDKSGFLFAETIYIEGEVMDSPVAEPIPASSDHEEEASLVDDKIEDPYSESEDDKSVRSITDIIETSLTSGRELRRSHIRYNESSDEDDFLKTSSSSNSEESDSDQDTRSEKGRGRGRPPKNPPASRPPVSRRGPQDRQTEEELVQQIAQETNKRFVCRSCFKGFAYKKCLRNHYEAQHPDWLNGPDEDDLLRRVTATKRKKHQSSDDETRKINESPRKTMYQAQPMKALGHDYQSPGRAAPFAKDTEPISESVVSVPTNEPNLPEPNAATYSIVVTVKGPPSFIKTYSKTKVLTDSIEKILHSPSPVSSPKTIMIVPSSTSSQVSNDCLAKHAAEVSNVELPKENAVECNGNEVDDMEEINENYSLENYDDVEIIYPSEDIVGHPEEIINHPEEIIYSAEDVLYPSEVVMDDMTSLIVENVLEDIPYVCNEIVVETEDDLVGSSGLSLENTEEVDSPDNKTSSENCETDNVPARQPVVCLERLGSDIVEQFVTRLRPRAGNRLNQKITQKEKLVGSTSDSQRKLRCNVCGWRFKHNYHLRVHLLNHTKLTHFECLSCGSKFFSKLSYDSHLPKCASAVKTASDDSEISLPEGIVVECTNNEFPMAVESPQKLDDDEAVISEERPSSNGNSESIVAEKRITRQSSLTHIQEDDKCENLRKRKLRGNQIALEHKTRVTKLKKQKIEEPSVSVDKKIVSNGEVLTDAANLLSVTNGQPRSEVALEESGITVRKSKRRGASSGAGYYFLMHHGAVQRNTYIDSAQANVIKKKKINGMHSSDNKHQVNAEPVLQEDTVACNEPASPIKLVVQEESVKEAELDPRETSLGESGDVDSEITLQLEDMDDADGDKITKSPLNVQTDCKGVEENDVVVDVPLTKKQSKNANCTNESVCERVPVSTKHEVLSCDVDTKSNKVILTVVANRIVEEYEENVEGHGPYVVTRCEEEEKSRPSSTISTEASLKMSEITEMSISNSDLPSSPCVNHDKSEEDRSTEENNTHDLDLGLLGLRTAKADLRVSNRDNLDTNSEVRLMTSVDSRKSDELLTSSFETDDKPELVLASDTDELNDSAKSEASHQSSPKSSTVANKTKAETLPSTPIRRKVETGYYSWLNGEQFSRRKSWSETSGSSGQSLWDWYNLDDEPGGGDTALADNAPATDRPRPQTTPVIGRL